MFLTVCHQRADSAFTNCERPQLPEVLLDLAHRVNLKRFLKQPRAPKNKARAISQAIRVTAMYQLSDFATRLNSHQEAG
ncbi:hypothetical protein D0A34_06890 [Microcoleus vaginatus PCC 9802]|jgi:hypothetical protein|nr:hypothetical protein MicvaDRAFT_5433 [Microcoleus vaginatus FGP-2]UNU18636.1 hypothetical protein D0A34_06890 [Microcoleus vaginatus PCC 9802]